VREGFAVTIVTPAAARLETDAMTMEQYRVQARLLELGVRISSPSQPDGITREGVETACVFTDRRTTIETQATVLVTAASPRHALL